MKNICLLIFLYLTTLVSFAQNEKAIAMRGTYTNVKKIVVNLKDGTTLTYSTENGNLYAITFLGDHGFKVYMAETEIASVDYVYSEILSTTIVMTGEVDPEHPIDPIEDNNKNRNTGDVLTKVTTSYGNHDATHAWQYEYPKLTGGESNLVIRKATPDYGDTFAVEWDCTKKANRWTCYRLDALNSASNVTRKNAFKEDSDIHEDYQSTLEDYSDNDFSRGHLCPSADRLASKEQNAQTFLLSNMQPQYQAHNGGKWAVLEGKVRTWYGKCDTLYIVKAATIDDVTLDGNTESGLLNVNCGSLIVPAYFYMALLAYNKSSDSYNALGIWTNHADDASNITIEYISIDELEKRTGIDFFCNLRDDKEDEVEATFNETYWGVSCKKSRATFDIERELANNQPIREEIDSSFIESSFDGIERANSIKAR